MTGDTTVLIADDERAIAETFGTALDETDGYTSRVAIGGEEAIERLDETVDAALLDRRMPRVSGDEVLSHAREVGYDCPMGMVTAVTPTTDTVALPFDLYLTKPVTTDEVVSAAGTLTRLADYETTVREEFVLARKRALLRLHDGTDSSAYQRLADRFESARSATDRTLDGMDTGDVRRALARI